MFLFFLGVVSLWLTLGFMVMETYRKQEPLTKLVVLKAAAKIFIWPIYLGYKISQDFYRFWTGLPDE